MGVRAGRKMDGQTAVSQSNVFVRARGAGRSETDLAVDVEDAVAVVDGDGPVAHEPGHEAADTEVEGWDVAAKEEEELEEVEADDGVPEPRADGFPGL